MFGHSLVGHVVNILGLLVWCCAWDRKWKGEVLDIWHRHV